MSKIVFASEGITEVNFILKLLELKEGFLFNDKNNKKIDNKELSPQLVGKYENNDIYLANFGGVNSFKKFIEKFCDNRPTEIDKLIFIVDADFYNAEKQNGDYKNRKKSIEGYIKKIKEKIEIDYGECKILFDYYITPNNKDDGMTEDICLKSINCQKIVEYIKNEVIEKVEKTGEANIKNISKSTFMMVSATQDPLRGSSHLFIDNCFSLFNQEEEELVKFKEFIYKNLVIN